MKIYVYITESLGCTHETNNIVNQLHFNKIKKNIKNDEISLQIY